MVDLNGWIALHRKFRQWGWYSDPITKAVFLELLLTANWKDGEYKGHQIKRGQTVIGRRALAKTLGISEQQVRTALKHLEDSGEITRKSTNRFTIATLCKFNDYQDIEIEGQPTDNQQATNKQPHLNKYNNKQDYINIYKISEIVDYLNLKTGKKYRLTRATKDAISHLLDEGYTVEDMRRVVDKKSSDWNGTQYAGGLAPRSLFDADKFDGYLNESHVRTKADANRLKREYMRLQIKDCEVGLDSDEQSRMNELEEQINGV